MGRLSSGGHSRFLRGFALRGNGYAALVGVADVFRRATSQALRVKQGTSSGSAGRRPFRFSDVDVARHGRVTNNWSTSHKARSRLRCLHPTTATPTAHGGVHVGVSYVGDALRHNATHRSRVPYAVTYAHRQLEVARLQNLHASRTDRPLATLLVNDHPHSPTTTLAHLPPEKQIGSVTQRPGHYRRAPHRAPFVIGPPIQFSAPGYLRSNRFEH